MNQFNGKPFAQRVVFVAMCMAVLSMRTTDAKASDCPYHIATPFKTVRLFSDSADINSRLPVYETIDRKNGKTGKFIGMIKKAEYVESGALKMSYISGYTPLVSFEPDKENEREQLIDSYHLGDEIFSTAYIDKVGEYYLLPLFNGKAGWVKPGTVDYDPSEDGFGEGSLVEIKPAYLPPYDKNYFKAASMMIVKMSSNFIDVRPEQPADMQCEAGPELKLKPFKATRVPFSKLYDSQCRMLITPTYPKGC